MFCDEYGIEHNFSAPRTPQQNDVVERKNRSLEEIARALMNYSMVENQTFHICMSLVANVLY